MTIRAFRNYSPTQTRNVEKRLIVTEQFRFRHRFRQVLMSRFGQQEAEQAANQRQNPENDVRQSGEVRALNNQVKPYCSHIVGRQVALRTVHNGISRD